jgi:peptide/nickel transport system permease protein
LVRLLIRDKLFMLGFLFITILMILSLLNSILNDGNVRQVPILFDKNGQVIGSPPFAPSFHFPLGTDRNGYDMLHIIIQGAKFTIGIALLITILRITLSIMIGGILGVYFKNWIPKLETFFDSFTVVPLTLIAYFILINVLWMPIDGFPHPFWKRAAFEVFVLTVLAIPTLAFYIANDIQKVFTEEFIQAAQILGGSKLHILKVHVVPHVVENWVLLSIQQFIQVLMIMAHLGVLQLFFGGTFVDYTYQDPPKTISYEWSGLIGDSYQVLNITPWISIVPIVFFSLTIISAQFMLNGVKRAFAYKKGQKILKIIK